MDLISTKDVPTLFLSKFKNLYICIQLDFLTLVALIQLANFTNVSTGFQLEDLISGMNV